MVKQTSKQASQGTSNKISTCNSIQSEAVVIFEETHPIRPNQSTHVFSGHTTVPDPEDSTHYISKDVIKTQCTLNINQDSPHEQIQCPVVKSIPDTQQFLISGEKSESIPRLRHVY
ncbi:hypothetical protein MJO29_005493 [Puccinia striiformis f. sp. tritici]|nr:hypothetical protein MJO29_005493 [Puccinia striiformis f. sp. tritici]